MKRLQTEGREPNSLHNPVIGADFENEAAAAFSACISLHTSGRLDAAERGYQTILETWPRHAETLHNLGIIALQTGRLLDAGRHLQEAHAASPKNATVLVNLAFALFHLGRAHQAIKCCDEAADINPRVPEVFNIRGMAQSQLSLFKEALGSFESALAADPKFADAQVNKGLALKNLGSFEEAMDAFCKAITIDPNSSKAYNNLGNIQRTLGRSAEAQRSYDRAVDLNPHFQEAHLNRCINRLDSGDIVGALQLLQQLRIEHPSNLRFEYLHGHCLSKLARHADALHAFQRVLRANPEDFEAIYGTAVAYSEMGEADLAARFFDAALRLKPESPEAIFGKSLTHLQAGDLGSGLRGFEARKRIEGDMGIKPFGFPIWDGSQDLNGRKILVHEEQGFGDSFQFCRFILPLETMGADVTFAAKKKLHGVLASLSPTLRLDEPDTSVVFDFGISLLSLPLAIGLTKQSISPAGRYLHPTAPVSNRWRDRLKSIARPRIGVAWRSNVLNTALIKRTIPFELFSQIMSPRFSWVSLQLEMTEEEKGLFSTKSNLYDFSADIEDFDDTAAIIDELDLVISVDTVVAHLAGALAAPVWILLCKSADWRWFSTDSESSWYHSAQLLRQSILGDWSSVLADVTGNLNAWPPSDAACQIGRSANVSDSRLRSAPFSLEDRQL